MAATRVRGSQRRAKGGRQMPGHNPSKAKKEGPKQPRKLKPEGHQTRPAACGQSQEAGASLPHRRRRNARFASKPPRGSWPNQDGCEGMTMTKSLARSPGAGPSLSDSRNLRTWFKDRGDSSRIPMTLWGGQGCFPSQMRQRKRGGLTPGRETYPGEGEGQSGFRQAQGTGEGLGRGRSAGNQEGEALTGRWRLLVAHGSRRGE